MTQIFEKRVQDCIMEAIGIENIVPEEAEAAARELMPLFDAEVAEKDRRIAELEKAVKYECEQKVIAIEGALKLEARIEAGMALAEHWKAEGKRCYDLAHKRSKVDDSIMAQSVRFWHCADELRAALGEPVRKP
jgi:hypothetical protein